MKKISVALSLLLICIFVLSSCSVGGSKSALTINSDTDINGEIFTYFLNEAYYSDKGYTEDECIEKATSKCLEYTAVNTQFAKSGDSLSPNDKADISLEVNSLWRMYGKYFGEIGVSKDTYFKIKQYEFEKENLRFALYGKGGSEEISEDYIKQYFTANYVGIKYFYEELYTPVSDEGYNALSDTEKASYTAEKNTADERYDFISGIANYVNSGVYTIDEAFMAVTGEVSADISVSATVVGKNDTSFSKEFIEAVFKQSVGSAFIITNASHSYIYFIERVNLLDDEYNFFDDYSDECLVSLSDNFFVSKINSWVQSYNALRHLSVVNRCFSDIKKVDRSKYAGTEDYAFGSLKYTDK